MKKNTAFVLGFSVLLVFVIVFCAVWGLSGGSQTEENPDSSPNQETQSSPSADLPSQDVNSEAPSESPSDDAVGVQEPDNSQTTGTVEPVKTSNGSFSSNTGTALNLVVNWQAGTRPTGEVDITFEICVTSYEFYTDNIPSGLLLTVEDAVYTLTSAAVAYDGQTLKSSTLATYTATLPSGSTTAEVSVKWNYEGQYSGVDLENIEISDTISF